MRVGVVRWPSWKLSVHEIQSQGQQRSYILYVPASYDGTKPVPVVFDFHGGMVDAQSAENGSGFRPLADSEGYVYVAPQGIDNFWDAMTDSDELFVRDLVKELEGAGCIDRKRIYSTGCSNGAAISFWLACHAADVFAAIAPLCGTAFFDLATQCMPSRPVPTFLVIGRNDELNCWEGEDVSIGVGGITVPCAKTVQAALTDIYACKGEIKQTHGVCETVDQCDQDAEVTICRADTGSGGLQAHVAYQAMDLEVTQVSWEFLSRFYLR